MKSKNKNDLKNVIDTLKTYAPKIFDIIYSDDMGYEFTAIHSDGIIFSKPGMLLISEHGGYLPLEEWDKLDIKELNNKLDTFLLDLKNLIVTWDELLEDNTRDYDLYSILEDIVEKDNSK